MNKAYSIYRNAKKSLKTAADECKRTTSKTDKPYIRQVINDQADSMIKQINWHAMKETISQRQAQMFSNWLSSYAADLHP